MAATKMLTLKSSDGEVFEVEEYIGLESHTIKHMVKDDVADGGIPIPNVTCKILSKVIEYCKKHAVKTDGDVDASSSDVAAPPSSEALEEWDTEFMKIDLATLYDLILVANYLNIKGLLDLTCQTVADTIKGKSPDEIRKHFNIANDFTPEEETDIRRENQWDFEWSI